MTPSHRDWLRSLCFYRANGGQPFSAGLAILVQSATPRLWFELLLRGLSVFSMADKEEWWL